MPHTAVRTGRVPVERLLRGIREDAVGLGHHVRYLDLGGDGVPDAVLTLDRRIVGEHSGQATVEEVINVAVAIGVDGRPGQERRYERLVQVPASVGAGLAEAR
jgi:hypothetical protein